MTYREDADAMWKDALKVHYHRQEHSGWRIVEASLYTVWFRTRPAETRWVNIKTCSAYGRDRNNTYKIQGPYINNTIIMYIYFFPPSCFLASSNLLTMT